MYKTFRLSGALTSSIKDSHFLLSKIIKQVPNVCILLKSEWDSLDVCISCLSALKFFKISLQYATCANENTKAKTQKRKYKEKPNMVSESRCQSLGGADQSSSPLSIPAIVSKICGDSDDKGAALACFKNYKYSFLLLFSPLLVCTPLLIEKCSALFPMCLSLRRNQKRRPAVHVAFAGTGVDLIL
jgi:hypothetical protein